MLLTQTLGEKRCKYFTADDFFYWDYSRMNDITKLSNHILDFKISDYCDLNNNEYPLFTDDYHPPHPERVFQTRRIGGRNGFPFVRGIQVRQEGEETFMCK